MSREPTMTIGELARHTGMSEANLYKRAQRIPFPAPIVFSSSPNWGARNKGHRQLNRYTRSELLAWFELTQKEFRKC